jgi:putative spermidine/putrescine transport system substrate-binding protein
LNRVLLALIALSIAIPAQAQDKLVVSIWGGSWRDLVRDTVAKEIHPGNGCASRIHNRRHY